MGHSSHGGSRAKVHEQRQREEKQKHTDRRIIDPYPNRKDRGGRKRDDPPCDEDESGAQVALELGDLVAKGSSLVAGIGEAISTLRSPAFDEYLDGAWFGTRVSRGGAIGA